MSEEEVFEATRISVDALEQRIGQKGRSSHATAFSIWKVNKWTFEILMKNGITRDTFVYPAVRDLG